MNKDLIANQFAIPGTVASVSSFGGGHINDTFQVKNGVVGQPSYLLQKVNNYVFKDMDVLMRNTVLVTEHIKKKLVRNEASDIERKCLEVINTKTGNTYFTDKSGKNWRIFNFISDNKVYDAAPNLEIAFEGARMFGEFQNFLSDLEPSLLQDTIPDFHNLEYRLRNLAQEIKEDKVGRVKYLKEELTYIETSQTLMGTIQRLGNKGSIPVRVTHNDTKINNVLFDENDKGLCVIDLDTVMQGYAHYDFGDGVRTTANTGKEDDEDLKNISYDLEMFRAFSAGYIDSTKNLLNEIEKSTLANASLLFPFIMGVRFLTDYIAGDVYYKTNHKEHNLVRAKAQFKLAQDGELKLKEMETIIKSLN